MSSKGLFKSPPPKLKSFKNDIAPIGFYFDLFAPGLFKIPVMPVPMRIDKISNGKPTLFIVPNIDKLNELCEKLNLSLNFELFFIMGFKNLIKYTKKKYKEITFRTLEDNKIIDWFNYSKVIKADLSYLTNDFTFLTSEFLKLYSKIDFDKDLEEYHHEFIQYCGTQFNFLKDRIESNILENECENIIKVEKLYEERENKYFPNILSLKIYNSDIKKWKNMNFVPYLIYDDLFDSFSYNKKLLDEEKYSLIDLQLWKENNIINNGSKTNEFDFKKFLYNLNIKDLK
ncbi:MAG: hypothetical protein ACFFDX_01850 [Candidatus Odinarchaeota archaeon]